MKILKTAGYEREGLKGAIVSSFEPFGGLRSFVKKGEEVLLKPNLLAGDPKSRGTTTHPELVMAVAEAVKEAGGIPVIGDSPAFGTVKQVAKRAGLWEEAEGLGVKIIDFKPNVTRDGLRLTKTLEEHPKVINLPKLKAHSQLGFTCSVKNLYGFVAGKAKTFQHLWARGDIKDFANYLIDIWQAVLPCFTIVDAIEVMTVTGPRSGRLKNAGIIGAGVNPMALDAALARIFRIPRAPILEAASSRGFKEANPDNIEILTEGGMGLPLEGFIFPSELKDISFSVPRVAISVLKHLYLLIQGD